LKPSLLFILFFLLFAESACTALHSSSQPVEQFDDTVEYLLAPGDLLEISVWKEEGLQQLQILVAPDGNINMPLIGSIMAAGKPISVLQDEIADKLKYYIANPVVNVKLHQSTGNTIFVIGKVNKPGQFPVNRRIDVLQALSLAGGLTFYADEDSIHVLRRVGNEIKVFPFDYNEVMNGEHLEQNILLEPGDTVSVP
jgi:polysaccharide export outer membrane protein